MSEIKICVAGATGRVGKGLIKAILSSNEFKLVAAVGRSAENKTVSSIINDVDCELIIHKSVATALTEALIEPGDVLIDYTKPDIVKENVITAIKKGMHVVIGTSGLTDQDYQEIDQLAQAHKVGVLAAGNFAITAVLMQQFAKLAAPYVGNWEIVDYCEDAKPDAPSGTARELAHTLLPFAASPNRTIPNPTKGIAESRGANLNSTQIHSVRLPGFYMACEVLMGLPGERLIIRHESIDSATPYITGTLLAARKVGRLIGLQRGLASVLSL